MLIPLHVHAQAVRRCAAEREPAVLVPVCGDTTVKLSVR